MHHLLKEDNRVKMLIYAPYMLLVLGREAGNVEPAFGEVDALVAPKSHPLRAGVRDLHLHLVGTHGADDAAGLAVVQEQGLAHPHVVQNFGEGTRDVGGRDGPFGSTRPGRFAGARVQIIVLEKSLTPA